MTSIHGFARKFSDLWSFMKQFFLTLILLSHTGFVKSFVACGNSYTNLSSCTACYTGSQYNYSVQKACQTCYEDYKNQIPDQSPTMGNICNNPDYWDTEDMCLSLGYYWWDGTCHGSQQQIQPLGCWCPNASCSNMTTTCISGPLNHPFDPSTGKNVAINESECTPGGFAARYCPNPYWGTAQETKQHFGKILCTECR